MSHGSKKWIVAYDGNIKRSNDLTKKDYLRELVVRHGPYDRHGNKGPFCPQCRYIAKQNDVSKQRYYEVTDRLRKQFESTFNEKMGWRNDGYYAFKIVKGFPSGETIWFYEWLRQHPDAPVPYWHNNWRNYLCFKCERKTDIQYSKWNGRFPGTKRNYNHSVKKERRDYRSKVKQLMKNAKYNEELYDDIPVQKHNWLD